MSAQCTLNMFTVGLILFFYGVHHVSSIHTSFCIRLPKDKKLDPSYGHNGDSEVASVGVEKFPEDIWGKYAFSVLDNTDGTAEKSFTKYAQVGDADAGLKLGLFPLRGRRGSADPFAGWFRVQVSTNFDFEFVKSFILFAIDDQANFVGTFEHDVIPDYIHGSDCPISDETRHMIIPCGGVSKYEPFVSNVVLYARNDSKSKWPVQYKEYWPIVPDYNDRNQLNFYYRYSIQASNKNKIMGNPFESHLIFRIIADPDHLYTKEELQYQLEYEHGLLTASAHFLIRDGAIPGAADPLPSDRRSLGCTQKMKSDRLEGRNNAKDFYVKGDYHQYNWQWFVTKYFDDQADEASFPGIGQMAIPVLYDFTVNTLTGCSARFFGGRCTSTLCSKYNEGVRHPSTKRNEANFDLIPQIKSAHQCSCGWDWAIQQRCVSEKPEVPTIYNNEATMFPGSMSHYKNQVIGDGLCPKTEKEAQNTVIRVIRRRPNGTKITIVGGTVTHINSTSYNMDKNTRYTIEHRGIRVFGAGTVLYSVRKGHGVLMILVSIFCVPVSIFVSRYYKETFMTIRILYSRVWFQIHIQLVYWMCALFSGGLLLAFVGRGFLGVSLHPYGLMHRVFGWTTFALFIVLACTGGIRMYDEPGRSTTIIAHWALGYIFYIFNMLSVISSFHVPGSPTAQIDKSVDDRNENGGFGDFFYIVIVFWIVFELVIHVTMNFFISTYDRWMQVEEPRKLLPPYIGVAIPVLKENANFDASGSGVRLITFWIYIGVSTMTTLIIAGLCVKAKPGLSIGFGPMSCTHKKNETLDTALYHSVKFQLMKEVDPSCFY